MTMISPSARPRRGAGTPGSGATGAITVVASLVGPGATMATVWSVGSTGVASTAWPASRRSRSRRISSADWYRLSGFFASAFSTTASSSEGISATSALGGLGASRTCL